MKRITIKDIARHLCISVSTVSRALTDDKNIRRETREQVLAAAKELGYRPNPVATNLKYGHTNTVGVIVPEMVTPFAAKVIKGIQEVLYANKIKVIIADSNEDPEQEYGNLRMMEQFMVDGIIVGIADYKRNQDEYRRLQAEGMPLVFYDRIPYGLDVSKVIVDDYMKAFFLVERLIRSGRRHIAHIHGGDGVYNATERYRGYCDALDKFHLPLDKDLVIKSGLTFADGTRAADRLLAVGKPFDAVFAFTDTLAIGMMNRLREQGRRIPDDIAVASFSGTELSTIVNPRLTTVEPPLLEIGRTAAKLILERIADINSPRRSVVLDAEIMFRDSTGI